MAPILLGVWLSVAIQIFDYYAGVPNPFVALISGTIVTVMVWLVHHWSSHIKTSA